MATDDKEPEKYDYRVYPTVDPEDGGYILPDKLNELCLLIDEYDNLKSISEYNQGVFNTIMAILAARIGLLQGTLQELLEGIIDEENVIDGATDDNEEDEEANEVKTHVKDTTPKYVHSTHPNDLPPETAILDDISDEDLMAELAAETSNTTPFDEDSSDSHGRFCGMY